MTKIIVALLSLVLLTGFTHSETWKKDRYGYETWRSDKGEVWKKDRYGYETWRSNRGTVCKQDRYGENTVRCK